MTTEVSIKPMADWTDDECEALLELSHAVYPPAASAQWPGRHLEWAAPEWGVRVVDDEGKLVSYTGIVLRQASHDGRSVRIGGVGGVKTHPVARRQGYAAVGLRRAAEFFGEQPEVEFALLVCDPALMDYYARLGWNEFAGQLLATHHGQTEPFTFNRVMVLDVHAAAPRRGTLDLLGRPW